MSNIQSDIDRGLEAIKYFHNQASRYESYSLTLEELKLLVSKGKPQSAEELATIVLKSTRMKVSPSFLKKCAGIIQAIEQTDLKITSPETREAVLDCHRDLAMSFPCRGVNNIDLHDLRMKGTASLRLFTIWSG